MKKVAVTGGLASGKTTVCQFFKKLGACVISADEVVHRILSFDRGIIQKVEVVFGKSVIENGQVNRKKLADLVFSHQEKLKQLEALLHPAVFHEIEKAYQMAKNSYPLFVAEIPLLYESGKQGDFDAVILVEASVEIAKARAGTDYDQRMARQMPLEEKRKRADYCIVNNGNLGELQMQVEKLYTELYHT